MSFSATSNVILISLYRFNIILYSYSHTCVLYSGKVIATANSKQRYNTEQSLQICMARRNVLKSTSNAFPGIINLKIKTVNVHIDVCYTKNRHSIHTLPHVPIHIHNNERDWKNENRHMHAGRFGRDEHMEKLFNSLKDLLNLALCGE